MLHQRASFFTAIYRRSLAILATIYFLDPFEKETGNYVTILQTTNKADEPLNAHSPVDYNSLKAPMFLRFYKTQTSA